MNENAMPQVKVVIDIITPRSGWDQTPLWESPLAGSGPGAYVLENMLAKHARPSRLCFDPPPATDLIMTWKPRLNRMFAADGHCFDVAIDHGFFNEAAVLTGIENMGDAVKTVVTAGPDAIQLTVGQARLLQDVPGPRKPALVLRTDVANVYHKELPRYLFSQMIEQAVEQALRIDAACLCINLLELPGQPEVHAECIRNICRLKPEADRYGMPVMIEPLVMQDNAVAGGYMVDGDITKIKALVRQAVELGADVIKADPTDDITAYHEVIDVAGHVPVLVRGGGKAPEREILDRTHELMDQGAKGIVYGRNVVQHENPAAITRALMSIVHEDATSEQAMEVLQGSAMEAV